MEKLSRVKKYENLRNTIDTESTVSNLAGDELTKERQEALEKFDSSVLKKINIAEDTYIPEREKEFTLPENEEPSVIDDTFTNEYLDDFIREVREYNIKKGNRDSEDTQVDILSQLNAAHRAKRSHYVEQIDDEKDSDNTYDFGESLTHQNIAKEVQNLINLDPIDPMGPIDDEPQASSPSWDMNLSDLDTNVNSTLDDDMYATTQLILNKEAGDAPTQEVKEAAPVFKEEHVEQQPAPSKPAPQPTIASTPEPTKPIAKKILQPAYDISNTDLYDTKSIVNAVNEAGENVDPTIHKKLIQETQQLRTQMDEYEDDLTDLSDGVEKNNKILNFILAFLILVLLAIIGFIIYTLWKGGGL